ncbi:LysM peptidoglycan-binding domain-containing protein [Actinomycetospora sp. CA-053990]|uniref:LysM peptidoglycan-binding domain-containing protein n=1 Tax=Actinomycetospora sp. CA-053990 TaxID=3239891 RepID=UPI003D92361F
MNDLVDALEGPARALAPAALDELLLQAGADPDHLREQVDTFATENGLAWDDGVRDGVARALGDATQSQGATGGGTPGTGGTGTPGAPGTGPPGTGTPGTGTPGAPATPGGPSVTAGTAPVTGGGGAGAAGAPDGDATAAPAETGTAGALQTARLGRWIATAWARGPPALGRFLAALGVGTLIALGPLGLASETLTGPVAEQAATSTLRDAGATTTLPLAVPAADTQRPTVLWLREGDTLGRIARSLGVGLDELAAANPTLTDLDRVAAGAPIALPETWQGTWNVRRGDTLGAIAGRFGLTPPQVGAQDPERFGGRSLDLIRTGETLRLGPAPTTPGAEQPSTPQPGQAGQPTTPTPTAAPAPTTPAPTTTTPTTTSPVAPPAPSPAPRRPPRRAPGGPGSAAAPPSSARRRSGSSDGPRSPAGGPHAP